MPVNSGERITSSDFNTLVDLANDFFSDACTVCSFGDSNQQFGWGGSSLSYLTSELIKSSDGNVVIDRANLGVGIINSVSGVLSNLSLGDRIESDVYNAIETKLTNLKSNKNDINVAETSIHAGTTSQRTTSWSSTINTTIRYTFTDFDETRYFFNSGGAFLLSLSLTGGSTGNANNWANLFSNIGTITFDFDDTNYSGSGGSPTAIGYYDLTTSYQNIFTATGTGAYTDNDLIIRALRSASGDYIDIQVILQDDHAGTVNGTTTLTAQYRKLDDQSSGGVSLSINAPSVSVQDSF